eukprot:306493-Pelagomonas_calceolata.AAC.2
MKRIALYADPYIWHLGVLCGVYWLKHTHSESRRSNISALLQIISAPGYKQHLGLQSSEVSDFFRGPLGQCEGGVILSEGLVQADAGDAIALD